MNSHQDRDQVKEVKTKIYRFTTFQASGIDDIAKYLISQGVQVLIQDPKRLSILKIHEEKDHLH